MAKEKLYDKNCIHQNKMINRVSEDPPGSNDSITKKKTKYR
jgi:hypothetical protein